MDDMLRTLVLLVTHLTMLGAGVGLAGITLRSRRQSLDVREAVLDTRELFLAGRVEQLRRGVFAQPGDPKPTRRAGGRHRKVNPDAPDRAYAVPKPPKLLKAGLDEAVALLATARAIREQERRAFVDLMTNTARAPRWVQASARIPVSA